MATATTPVTASVLDPCACPGCGRPNACACAGAGAGAGAGAAQASCWCFDVDVPRSLLQSDPSSGRACFCADCVRSAQAAVRVADEAGTP